MRKATWVLVGLGVLAVAEIALLVWVAGEIGVGWTLLVLLALAAVGGFLLRREGGKAWASLREARDDPDAVGRKVSDAALVLVGGLLLMLPGFVTDVFGFVFLLPFTRPYARRVLGFIVARRVARMGVNVDVIRAQTDPENLIRGEVVEPYQPSPNSDHDVVIKGEIEDDTPRP